MSAAHVEQPSADMMVARLDEMLAELADAVIDGRPVCDAARIDRIARLEIEEPYARQHTATTAS